MTDWRFGEEPLAETERFAAVARRVADLVMRMEQPSPVVATLTDELERAAAQLEGLVPPVATPRVGDAVDGEGRVYLDHSRHVGRYDPAFPEYELQVAGDRAEGTVSFPMLFEGPPGYVHGGFVAVLFDLVIQHHNCAVGVAGKTAGLDVRYHAPTPVLVPLRIDVARTHDDRWIHSTATLHLGDVTCATGTVRAIAGDHARLPHVSPRRDEGSGGAP